MSSFHVAVIPVGRVSAEEVEASLQRAARALRQPLELRGSIPVPQGIEESERGQFRASLLMQKLRGMVPQLGQGKMIGPEGATDERPPFKTDGYVFVTDADLYTANKDTVYAALKSAAGLSVVSLRRIREAYYRRKADPVKQRNRMVKEIIRMVARLRRAPACGDPKCVLAASEMIADLDTKEEKFCRSCSQRLFEGRVSI
ncbi:MAG: hypothetical protein OEV00_02230 [Acidobacteriota bacterium]|nr:hypothetical protein [Acidobacteriota bacterium]MDH3784126.1 hypothetical protein [Acidobacteriota bacterium]